MNLDHVSASAISLSASLSWSVSRALTAHVGVLNLTYSAVSLRLFGGRSLRLKQSDLTPRSTHQELMARRLALHCYIQTHWRTGRRFGWRGT